MGKGLLKRINAVRQRVLLLAWFRAVCWALSISVAAVIVILLMDTFLRIDSNGLRLAMLMAIVGAVTFSIVNWILPVLAYRPGATEIASRIEQITPNWHNELVTSVQLAERDTTSQPNFSGLETGLIKRATERLDQLPVASVTNLKSLPAPILTLLTIAAIAGLFFATLSAPLLFSLKRIATPWSQANWPSENQLEFVNLANSVPLGSDVEFSVFDQLDNIGSDVQLQIETASGIMTRSFAHTDGNIYRTVVKNVRQDFRARAIGGDCTTKWFPISVFEAPALTSYQLTWQHKSIDGGRSQLSTDSIEYWPDATFKFEGESSKLLSAARLIMESKTEQQMVELVVDNNLIRSDGTFSLNLGGPVSLRLEISDAQGHINTEAKIWRATPLQNMPPRYLMSSSVDIAGSNTPLDLEIFVTDEFTILTSELIVSLERNGETLSNSKERILLAQSNNSDSQPNETNSWAQRRFVFNGPNAPQPGDIVIASIAAEDESGQAATGSPLRIRIAGSDELNAYATSKLNQIKQHLGELRSTQQALNLQWKQWRGAPESIESGWRLTQSLDTQDQAIQRFRSKDNSIIALTDSLMRFVTDNNISQQNQSIKSFSNLLDQPGRNSATQLARGLEMTQQHVRIYGTIDFNSAAQSQFESSQDEFAQALEELANMLGLTTSFQEIISGLARLHRELEVVETATLQAQQEFLINKSSEGVNELVSQQLRLVRLGDLLIQQIRENAEVATPAPEASVHLATIKLLAEKFELDQLSQQLSSVVPELRNSRFGSAAQLQRTSIIFIESMLTLLDQQYEPTGTQIDSDSLNPGDQLNELITELVKIGDRLTKFANSNKGMNESDRTLIDQDKTNLQSRIAGFVDEAAEELPDDIAQIVRNAGGLLADSASSTSPDEIRVEAGQVEQAIAELRRAALDLGNNRSDPDQVDLAQVLQYLQQILQAQKGVAKWVETQTTNARLDKIECDRMLLLQRDLIAGCQDVALSLSKNQLAVAVLDRIRGLQGSIVDRIQRSQFDSVTSEQLETAIGEFELLVEAIQIQLQSNNDKSEVDSEDSDDESRQNEPGISAFELTTIYVLQKSIEQQTKELKSDLAEHDTATEALRSQQRKLAAKQLDLAETLSQILSKQSSNLPALPDF